MSDPIRSHRDIGADAQLAAWQGPRRALFLDRDGVINVDHGYVHAAANTDFVPGIFDLVRAARAAGYLPIVVTNQAGIARGYYDEATFRDYTAWVHRRFDAEGAPLLATYFCPHHPTAGLGPLLQDCLCRKPKPGMLLQASRDFAIDLAGSRLLGDTQADLDAARAAGLGEWRRLVGEGAVAPDFTELKQATAWAGQAR